MIELLLEGESIHREVCLIRSDSLLRLGDVYRKAS